MTTEQEIALADRTKFVLNDENWENFIQLLDQEPKDFSALRELLNEPSVLENGYFEEFLIKREKRIHNENSQSSDQST